MNNRDPSSPSPIAIVSVHGVADQLPHESARQIAQLLLDHQSTQEQPPYQSFTETIFHLPETQQFNHIAKYLPETQQCDHVAKKTDVQPLFDASEKFLAEQLDPHRRKPLPFGIQKSVHREDQSFGVQKSIRLEGERQSSDSGDHNQPIHIYEMYWADLSQLKNDFFRIFSEFYQILFHLSRIGQHIVDSLNKEFGEQSPRLWNLYRFTQDRAESCLSLLIPLLNVFLLITAFTVVPLSLARHYLEWIEIALIALSCLLIIVEFIWQWPIDPKIAFQKPKFWGSALILILGLCCQHFVNLGAYHFISLVTAALFGGVAWVGVLKYNERRPHAFWVGAGLELGWVAIILWRILAADDNQIGIIQACLGAIEIIAIPLICTWCIFAACQVIAYLLGFIVKARTPKEFKGIIARGIWTARLSLSLPSALFILVTLTLWDAIARIFPKFIPDDTPYQALLPQALTDVSASDAVTYAHDFIVASATPSFILILAGIAIALLIGVFALLPSILAEILGFYSADENVKDKYDKWLNRGLRGLYYGTEIITIAMIIFSVWNICVLALKGMQVSPWPDIANLGHESLENIKFLTESKYTEAGLNILSIVIVSSATSLIALGSRLAKFTSGVRDLLDVVLDVDSYLRINPPGINPKSRIFNRYLALLQYICNWSNPNQPEQKYSALIIIAHSQGTVITADLLRFLQRFQTLPECQCKLDRLSQTPKNSDPLPIYLYTMGSPLKQLYNVAFPSLYAWMDDLKDINQFGLKYWMNVYCSGDYVGRSLWIDPKKSRELKDFDEECLGAGAHTHYWDSTTDKVAKYLDELVVNRVCYPPKDD